MAFQLPRRLDRIRLWSLEVLGLIGVVLSLVAAVLAWELRWRVAYGLFGALFVAGALLCAWATAALFSNGRWTRSFVKSCVSFGTLLRVFEDFNYNTKNTASTTDTIPLLAVDDQQQNDHDDDDNDNDTDNTTTFNPPYAISCCSGALIGALIIVILASLPLAVYPLCGHALTSTSAQVSVHIVALTLALGFAVLSTFLITMTLCCCRMGCHLLSEWLCSFGLVSVIVVNLTLGALLAMLMTFLPDMTWYLSAILFTLGLPLSFGSVLSIIMAIRLYCSKSRREATTLEIIPTDTSTATDLWSERQFGTSTNHLLHEEDKESTTDSQALSCTIVWFGLFLIGLSFFIIVSLLFSTNLFTSMTTTDSAHFTYTLPHNLANPALSGPYAIKSWVYQPAGDSTFQAGAGTLEITVPNGRTLNLSPLVDFTAFRTRYWRFDASAIPLRGLLWTPVGTPKPGAPIFLISAGNHQMTLQSAPGYQYLCQHLASHGYACASFDADFMNSLLIGSMQYDQLIEHGTGFELLARGLLYLEHASLLADWNLDPQNPLYGMLDPMRVVFAGHSRSGESACDAAWALRDLAPDPIADYPTYDIASVRTKISLQGVVAFAPTDHAYMPGGVPLQLRNINYLTIKGTHDIDQSNTFSALRQLNAIHYSSPSSSSSSSSSPSSNTTMQQPVMIKTAILVYRANHGQWNTVWGNADLGPASAWLLNRGVLLPSDQQQTIAKALLVMFLSVTWPPPPRSPYLSMMRDIRIATPWLPSTNYVQQFSDSHTLLLADFNSNNNQYRCAERTTASYSNPHLEHWAPSIYCTASAVNRWQQLIRDRAVFSVQPDNAVYLTPNAPTNLTTPPTFSISLPPAVIPTLLLPPHHTNSTIIELVFDWATSASTTVEPNPSLSDQQTKGPSIALVATFELLNHTLISHTVGLYDNQRLPPSLFVQFSKIGSFLDVATPIAMLQTFSIPLQQLFSQPTNDAINLTTSSLRQLDFTFQCPAPSCQMILDNVGFRFNSNHTTS